MASCAAVLLLTLLVILEPGVKGQDITVSPTPSITISPPSTLLMSPAATSISPSPPVVSSSAPPRDEVTSSVLLPSSTPVTSSVLLPSSTPVTSSVLPPSSTQDVGVGTAPIASDTNSDILIIVLPTVGGTLLLFALVAVILLRSRNRKASIDFSRAPVYLNNGSSPPGEFHNLTSTHATFPKVRETQENPLYEVTMPVPAAASTVLGHSNPAYQTHTVEANQEDPAHNNPVYDHRVSGIVTDVDDVVSGSNENHVSHG